MVELITEMVRKKTGYYDLRITTTDGKTLVDIRGITKAWASRLIDRTEKEQDEKSSK